MSFDGIKNQLKTRLTILGFIESLEPFDFDNTSLNAYEKTFIIIPVSGTAEEGEQITGQVYDTQSWSVQIAFGKSTHNDIIQKDKISRKAADIIKDLDNPTNWQGFTNGAIQQRYRSWELTDAGEYFLLTVILEIQDRITY